MNTSVTILALAGFLVAPSSGPEPSWLTDYTMALKKGNELKKPLAVVIGSGYKGYEKLPGESKLNSEARTALASRYVCVYLDGNKVENQRLVKAFEVRSGIGLVLSDYRGEYQAFHHDGPLSESDLLRQLLKHAPDQKVVTQTSFRTPLSTEEIVTTPPVNRAVYYPTSGRGVRQSSYAPARPSQNC